MIYRQFSRLNIRVSVIGFGTWAIGGNSYGAVDDKDSVRALEYAFDNGINLYDTANIYGNGHSERLLERTFKSKRNEIIIATKGGYRSYTKRIQDFSEKYIKESLENSLKRLATDYVDIFFLHSPPSKVILHGDAYETLCKIQKEGKIRFRGISVRTAEDGLLALRISDYDAIQVTYNLLDQTAKDDGLLDTARTKRICVIAKSPLSYGFLAGKYKEDSKFSLDDHRQHIPMEQRRRWLYATESLRLLSQKKKRSMAQSALQFCILHEGLTSAIPGMKTIKQVEENMNTLFASSLTKRELKKIFKIYSSFYSNNLF